MSSEYFRIVEHTVRCQHTREYIAATANGDLDTPLLAVKQYIPKDNANPQTGDVTIIGTHANGFPKEVYEPLWEDIYVRTKKEGLRIRSIWVADAWTQGKSGIANEGILGLDPSWADHSRDLLSLINQKQDEMPQPIVGVGHSMGGTELVQLALMHPRLLRSLVLIDPVITKGNAGAMPAAMSARRRDLWPARQAAVDAFRRNPYYRSWDPRVFERWMEHALREAPTELYPLESGLKGGEPASRPVTLATSKHQEIVAFQRPMERNELTSGLNGAYPAQTLPKHPFYRPEPLQVYERLPEVRSSVLYIFGRKSPFAIPEECEAKVRRTGSGHGGSGGVEAARVERIDLDCGHLMPMEMVGECAEAAVGFLGSEIQRWRKDQEAFSRWRQASPRRVQITVQDKWMGMLKSRM
ncbi:uncharacterized protein JN550_007980 [Neoarthrinium moseri]|uniref:uncharacterized protein n=1 Tax=Neoarthrinium moseri TaxID=1658444 RepID=UPI001FDCA56B|nr:uncharacterized protein JN550_007980 [Neoarthrinium moseri]KAI1866002.1 hypothetical protein JN550_007980 [Neoarthrinium moseri]